MDGDTALVVTDSAADDLRSVDPETRGQILHALEEISRDPAAAESVALEVKGDFSRRPLLTPVPGEPVAIFWTLDEGSDPRARKVIVLGVMTTNYDELLEGAYLERSPRGGAAKVVSSKELVGALQRLGFTERRRAPGHVVLVGPREGRQFTVVVPVTGKAIPRSTLHAILRQAGLTEEEFRNLIRADAT